jgi:hypothetical protein
MDMAQQAFGVRGSGVYAETTKISAHGAALLTLYLELQTLPGNRAADVLRAIDQWMVSATKNSK